MIWSTLTVPSAVFLPVKKNRIFAYPTFYNRQMYRVLLALMRKQLINYDFFLIVN